MSKGKVRNFEYCGIVGKSARSVARSLLSGSKVDKKEAGDAVAHIDGCDFCKLRIKNQVHDAREGKKEKAYSDSLPETLDKLHKLVS